LKFDECVNKFNHLVNESTDRSVNLWAGLEIGHAYKRFGENLKAEDEFDTLLYSLQDNYVAEFGFIRKLESVGAHRVCIKLLENIIQSSVENEIIIKKYAYKVSSEQWSKVPFSHKWEKD